MERAHDQGTANPHSEVQLESLDEQLTRWSFELGLATAFLPDNPFDALEWTRRIEREVTEALKEHPEAKDSLTELRTEVQSLRDQSHAVSRRLLADSERRQQAFEAREHQVFETPLRPLRQPWPSR